MTHLMGLTVKDEVNPLGDIAIEFKGLRPGEKLFEELLIGDQASKTQHQRILTANERSLHHSDVAKIIDQLKDAMCEEDEAKIRQILIAAPLDYKPTVETITKEKAQLRVCTHVA